VSTRPAVPVALTTAASLLGDTLLYTALPVNAARLELTPLVVGLALSLNRVVRFVTNPIAARLYERFPAGLLIVAAILIATATTAVYAVPAWLILFLGARLAWGFCWSLLRLGSYLSAIEGTSTGTGRRLGTMRSLFGLGYLAGTLYAPIAVEVMGWQWAALLAAALTLALGLPPALAALNWRGATREVPRAPSAPPRDLGLVALSLIGAVHSALNAGLLLVAGGLRVAELFPDGGLVGPWLVPATLLAALFVLSRRVAEIAWTPLAGRLADRSLIAVFMGGTITAAVGMTLLTLRLGAEAFLFAGALAFFGSITTMIATELAIAHRYAAHERARVLAGYGTWLDLGSAGGALAGGWLSTVGTAPALTLGAMLVGLTFPLWLLAGGRSLATAPSE
jgi:MFS family permease